MKLKTYKLITISTLSVLSLIFTLLPLLSREGGVTILEISEKSACNDVLKTGSTVTRINEINIKNTEDFRKAVENLDGRITLFVDGGPRACNIGNKTIDAEVTGRESSPVEFGIDIKGGRKITLEPLNLSKASGKLETRFQSYGLDNYKLEELSERMEITFRPREEHKVRKLIQPGIIEIKLIKELENDTDEISIGEQSYEINILNNSIEINGVEYEIGDNFVLNDIATEVTNVTKNQTSLSFLVTNSENLLGIVPEDTRLFEREGNHIYVVGVSLDEEAGKTFSKITKNQPVMINPEGEDYLETPLLITLDNETMTTVPIPKSESSQNISKLVIWGIEETKREAGEKFTLLNTFIKSGSIENLEVTGIEETSPEKENLLQTSIYIIIGLIITTSFYQVLRNKKIKRPYLMGLNITSLIILMGIFSSEIFAFLLLLSCIFFLILSEEEKDWKNYLNVFLMVLLSFWSIVNKPVIGSQSLIGCIIGFAIFFINIILTNELVGEKKLSNFIQIFNLTISLGLILIFFIWTYKPLASIASFTLLINLSMIKPIFKELVSEIS